MEMMSVAEILSDDQDGSGLGVNSTIMDDPEFLECVLLTVPQEIATRAASEVSGCEACSMSAQIPFDWILSDVMNRPRMFEFVLEVPVRCPLCYAEIREKTLVDRGGMAVPLNLLPLLGSR